MPPAGAAYEDGADVAPKSPEGYGLGGWLAWAAGAGIPADTILIPDDPPIPKPVPIPVPAPLAP